MNGTAFKLATLAKPDGNAFVAIVLGDNAIDLKAAHAAFRTAGRKSELSASATMLGLLEQWDKNFAVLQEVVTFLEKEGTPQDDAKLGTVKLASLKALPPVGRPGKMFYAAQNFQEHVNEMIRAGMSPSGGPVFYRREIEHDSLSVSQGAELPRRRLRRYRDPARHEEDRLGGGNRARHRQAGKAHQG